MQCKPIYEHNSNNTHNKRHPNPSTVSTKSNNTTGRADSAHTHTQTAAAAGSASTTAWLDRYGDTISADVAMEMIRIRDDLNNLEIQVRVGVHLYNSFIFAGINN